MILTANALSYRLKGKSLINEVSLTFPAGILYGILGPNGSGKSTFLKTLSGIWQPTSGQVIWKGENLLKKERREISKTISLVPQNPQVTFDFSVAEIVMMGNYPHGASLNKAYEEEKLNWSLAMVDAKHLRNRRATHLSNGERQRVYIARALMTESPILLLDEPTASVDIRHQLEIWELLTELKKKGKVIIVTTHDLLAAERYCDQIAIINQGQCVASGTFSEALSCNLLYEVFGVTEISLSQPKYFAL